MGAWGAVCECEQFVAIAWPTSPRIGRSPRSEKAPSGAPCAQLAALRDENTPSVEASRKVSLRVEEWGRKVSKNFAKSFERATEETQRVDEDDDSDTDVDNDCDTISTTSSDSSSVASGDPGSASGAGIEWDHMSEASSFSTQSSEEASEGSEHCPHFAQGE
eukprot:CAMPEP_0183457750 /NCGR_PEP_ID=MMETSP0370-20130417/132020_1 /TAXON_ID=268820 /ORGANISM="Peridinium aciculiferum, Strain PAER-2" /LENGTH=161 /DNA_ID=CAMNT_0025649483 /DNA_START=1 /DNA_END=483 /DNA_ORIENTATION=-